MKVGQNTNVEMLAAKLQQNAAQQAQQKQNGTASEVVQQTRSNAAGARDHVEFGTLLDQNSKTSSDVDMAKVHAIREAIANGTFKVNASVIADKMLVDASALLGLSRA